MNERIRELVEQATEYMQHGFTTQETYFDKEKFAELIVKECLNTLHNNGYDDAAVELQKHFKG